MKLYPYLNKKITDHAAQSKFASMVATRALQGGNARQLMDICIHMGRTFRRTVKQIMQEDSSGHHLLEAMLVIRDDGLLDMSLGTLRDQLDDWQCADDWDEIADRIDTQYGLIKCEDCDSYELGHYARGHWADDSPIICRSCIDNNYVYSDRYDTYVYCDQSREALDENGRSCTIHEDDDDFTYSDDEDTWIHNDYDPASRLIGNYHSSKNLHRVQPSAWTKMKNRYLGVELEVEVRGELYSRGDKAKLLHSRLNDEQFGKNVFFENDGSLNNGFEIISQPMGLDRHRELWTWLKSRDAIRGLRSHQTSTCGLHVHVSKENLTKLQIAKIVTFVNAPENEELIRAVARRYAEGYCKIKHKKIGQSASSEDRYEAVNITPRRTIEFRIFKGSLKYESVLAAIEFSNALVEFCAEGRTSIQQLNADKFIEFINKEIAEDTKYLRPYLEQRLETA